MLAVNDSVCLQCGACVPLCPEEALFLSFHAIECNEERCNMCAICILFCPVSALEEKNAAAV